MKPELHKSMLGCFDRCPMQYQFRYVQGLKIPPATVMVVGTGVHASAAADLKSKRDAGKLLPLQAVEDAARDTVIAEWEQNGVMLDADEKVLGEQRVRGETVDTAVSLAGLHHADLAPRLVPKRIEFPFEVTLNGFPVDLAGTLDLQEQSGAVRELKTRSTSPPAGLSDASLDLTFYGLAAGALDAVNPPSLALDCLVKTKMPKVVTQTTTRGKAAYRAFLMRVEVVCRAIESGIFPPCSPENWCCHPKYCGFFSICPYGASARVSG